MPSYDAGGFLAHFGTSGEGLPIEVVQYEPDKLGGVFTFVGFYAGANIGLDDRYDLKPS